MFLILQLYVIFLLSQFWTGTVESVRTLGLARPLKVRVALFDLLPVLIFDMRVQMQDVLYKAIEEGIDVFAWLDHRSFHLDLI